MKIILSIILLGSWFYLGAQTSQPIQWRKMSDNKDATLYEVREDFYAYWNNRTPEKGQGYKVFKRWENQISSRVFPSGDMTLLSNNYPNFMAWQEKYQNNQSNRSANGTWVSLSSGEVPSGYDAGAGKLNFITFDPNDEDVIYVGAPDGGLWKSTDAGDN